MAPPSAPAPKCTTAGPRVTLISPSSDGSTKATGTPARRCAVTGMPPTTTRMPLPALPRIEKVSKMPFCPVAPTPGTRVTRSWKSDGDPIASCQVMTSVASAEGTSAAVPLAVTLTSSMVWASSVVSGSAATAASAGAAAQVTENSAAKSNCTEGDDDINCSSNGPRHRSTASPRMRAILADHKVAHGTNGPERDDVAAIRKAM